MTDKLHFIILSRLIETDNLSAFTVGMDLTMKRQGRMTMSELYINEVRDGNITSEYFNS